MFSSLEALDTQPEEAVPAARQGAFQPKAKPRQRKGGGACAPAHPAVKPTKAKKEAQGAEVASRIDHEETVSSFLTLPENLGDDQTPVVANSERLSSDQTLTVPEVIVHTNNTVDQTGHALYGQTWHIDNQTAGEGGEGILPTSSTDDQTGRALDAEAWDFGYQRVQDSNQTVGADRMPAHPPEPQLCPLRLSCSSSPPIVEDTQDCEGFREHSDVVIEQLSVGMDKSSPERASMENIENLNMEATGLVKTAKKQNIRRRAFTSEEGNDESVSEKTSNKTSRKNASHLKESRTAPLRKERKRRQERTQNEDASLVKNPSHDCSLQESTQDLGKDCLGGGEPSLKSPKEPSEAPRRSKRVMFAANSQEMQQVAIPESDGNELANDKENPKKKRLKRTQMPRKRVERRTLNIADPDLDPKKMTLKDVIRFAESKERLLKKDAAKPKNLVEKTPAVVEAEQEDDIGASFVPQVQIIDGKIVINQESLTVAAHPKDDVRTYKRVEETHSKLNYHSYMKRTTKTSWKKEDTEIFYKALQEFGTNFAIIQHLFPGRSRKQIFLKYKKEERCSPMRVADAMTLKAHGCSQYMEVMTRMNLYEGGLLDTNSEHLQDSPTTSEAARVQPEGGACVITKPTETNEYVPKDKPQSDKETKEEGVGCGASEDGPSRPYGQRDECPEISETDGSTEVPRPDDTLKTESPPPATRAKSLFSFQNVGSKASKSVFSYHLS